VFLDVQFLMLQKIQVPSSSQSSLIGLLDPEDESTTVLQSVRNFKPKDMHHIPEDSNIQQHHCDNLKSCKQNNALPRLT